MGKTRGVHETTPEIRNRMVGMYEAGLGLREIAAAVNCSQRTVKRWLNRFNKEGNVDTRERCGRKRATTEEQDEAIVRLATQTPITAAKAVLPALGLNCSVDTVRERLHKAGIHNWSPSRKHIEKIPIAISDGSGIQQAVWRPTGTHLGKKKSAKESSGTKASDSQPKKKPNQSSKAQSKRSVDNAEETPREQTEERPVEQPNFSFSQPTVEQQQQPQINELQPLMLPPPPPPLPHPALSVNQSPYGHPLNSLPQPQPLYQHHPGLNISQTWPLDLVQSTHHYPQTLQHPVHHEQQHPPLHLQNHSHLRNNDNEVNDKVQHSQTTENQIQPALVHPLQNFSQQQRKIDASHREQNNQAINEATPTEKLNIACSEICSGNSNSSCSNENSRNSSASNEADEEYRVTSKTKRKTTRLRKKKGGKIKGTLETSVEIRNRMIGMSEAGLSTLSIALAINRSERTVKRWLDRWRREGNVQTKERKGRRRITTKEQDDAIVAMATQQPLTAAKHVVPALGLKCSVDTIRERLHKAGIHSWKLGKKPGEGNAVHTVHLWQPSGNRSNKIKTIGGKKKKSCRQLRSQTNSSSAKKRSKKETTETSSSPSKVVTTTTTATDVTPEKTNVQFPNQPQPAPVTMQTIQELNSPAAIVQPPPPMCSVNLAPNPCLQPMGPTIQQRPDCRLALSALVPAMPSQLNSSIPNYPSCMMGGATHAGHMEQSDPMNYEPYIWSF